MCVCVFEMWCEVLPCSYFRILRKQPKRSWQKTLWPYVAPNNPSQITSLSFRSCSVWVCWNKSSLAPRPRQWRNHLKSFKGSYFLPSPHTVEFDLPYDLQHCEICSRLKLKQTKHNFSSTSSTTSSIWQLRERKRQQNSSQEARCLHLQVCSSHINDLEAHVQLRNKLINAFYKHAILFWQIWRYWFRGKGIAGSIWVWPARIKCVCMFLPKLEKNPQKTEPWHFRDGKANSE